MGNRITPHEAAARLAGWDDIHLYCHNDPDGDTAGSAYGLYYALRAMGKRVSVRCRDSLPEKYSYMLKDYTDACAVPQVLVAVDTADKKLLAPDMADRHFSLCIDHHPSNTLYADEVLLSEQAPATAELMTELIGLLGVPLTPLMADCLFTGLVTDTGCFRYSSVTAHTLRTAARLMDAGAQAYEINRRMFETKTRSRLMIEKAALDSLQFCCGGKIAVISLTRKEIERSGAMEWELDGIAAMSKTIEGVEIGLFVKEREDGAVKASVRTSLQYDASKICSRFGGGGHARAAGCELRDVDMKTAAELLCSAAGEELAQHE